MQTAAPNASTRRPVPAVEAWRSVPSMRRLSLLRRVAPSWVLVATGLLAIAAAVAGGNVAHRLSLGGMEDPKSESVRTQDRLTKSFPGAAQPDFVLIVTTRRGTVDDAAVKDAGLAIQARLDRTSDVELTQSYWSLDNAPPLKSRDGTRHWSWPRWPALRTSASTAPAELTPRFVDERGPIRVEVTGKSTVEQQISDRAEQDLRRSEVLTAPLVFIALVLVFGSVVAAFLPLAVGVLAILGTFVVLTILSHFTTVSVFALNLTTALGLGLAIDYSLFIVSRYREELATRREPVRRRRPDHADRRTHRAHSAPEP